MNPTAQRAFCPVWAEKIEVKREDDVLLVRGWGQLLVPQDDDPSRAAQLNLLEQFRKYRLQQLSEKQGATVAGIYQFADATDDEKLFAFVRSYGPVWGSIRDLEADDLFHIHTITVAQDIGALRHEQRTFAAATKLLAEINRNGLADVGRITEALMTIFPAPSFSLPDLSLVPAGIAKLVAPNRPGTVEGEFYPWTWSMRAVHTLIGEKSKDRRQQFILRYAHHGLCQLLNSFPPHLFPAHGCQPVELPPINQKGILWLSTTNFVLIIWPSGRSAYVRTAEGTSPFTSAERAPVVSLAAGRSAIASIGTKREENHQS